MNSSISFSYTNTEQTVLIGYKSILFLPFLLRWIMFVKLFFFSVTQLCNNQWYISIKKHILYDLQVHNMNFPRSGFKDSPMFNSPDNFDLPQILSVLSGGK